MKYSVGIIDDDKTKITQLIAYLQNGWNDDEGKLLNEKYADVILAPIVLDLQNDIQSMINIIVHEKLDALIIDFKLSSQANISYNGVTLAQKIDKRLAGYPIFILTSYEDDLYNSENFDAYQVFDFARYISEPKERIEINSKIVQQIKKYYTTIESWRAELNSLIPKAGKSAEIDSRIIELDSLLERSIDGSSALPKSTKVQLINTNKIQELIDKIDKLISGD